MPPRRSTRASHTGEEQETAADPAGSGSGSSSSSSVFAGLTICTAGKHARTQAQLKQIVAENGGTAVGSQTKACTHLLADALGSAKTDAAVRTGVAVVTEQWLLQSAEEGELSQDPKLLLSAPPAKEAEAEAAEEGKEADSSSSAAAAAASAPKRKRDEDAEESVDGAAAAEAAASSAAAASSSSAASPAAKKQKGDDTADDDAAAAAPAAAASSSAAAPTAPAISFAGKKFILMGGFDAGKFKIESTITTLGGEVTTNVIKSLDYCVCGEPVQTDYGGVSGPGSKKYKEAKKMKRVTMLSEEQFFEAVTALEAAKAAEADASGSSGCGDGSTAAAGSDHEMVVVVKSILSLLGAGDTKLIPATLASVTAAEEEMRMALPPGLKALLLHVSDGSESLHLEGDLPYLWPSVSAMRQQFTLESAFPTIYRECRWLPFRMYESHPCWAVVDVRSGRLMEYDWEYNRFTDLGATFEEQFDNFHTFLQQRKEKEEKEAKEANEAATTTATAAAAEGAGVGEGAGTGTGTVTAAVVSPSGSAEHHSLVSAFESSPLASKRSPMDHAQRVKYNKACRKAGLD